MVQPPPKWCGITSKIWLPGLPLQQIQMLLTASLDDRSWHYINIRLHVRFAPEADVSSRSAFHGHLPFKDQLVYM
jgi:hypothetical protein